LEKDHKVGQVLYQRFGTYCHLGQAGCMLHTYTAMQTFDVGSKGDSRAKVNRFMLIYFFAHGNSIVYFISS